MGAHGTEPSIRPQRAGELLRIAGADANELAVQVEGSGPPIVLLHGLTATRRYVLMGSSTPQRSGFRVISYDARGHGQSEPAPSPGGYGYGQLRDDLLAVMDRMGIKRALLAGASMGAHTALAFALAHPDRVSALAIITPAFDPAAEAEQLAKANERWRALAAGLRSGGIDGFLAASGLESMPRQWAGTIDKVIRQRLSMHGHLDAVCDALEVVPFSAPFSSLEQLSELALPASVIGSRDEADPSHPLALAEAYARSLGAGEPLVEAPPPPPSSPIAWQGGRVGAALVELARRAEWNLPGTPG